MAEKFNLLSAKFAASDNLKAGSYADGRNLYLRVGASGSKSWVFRWQSEGKPSELGLGAFAKLGLAAAREKAGELREAVALGASKEALKHLIRPKAELADERTFKFYAERVIEQKTASPKYRSKKALAQWTATLERYAFPTIGHKRPDEITVGDVATVLAPLWESKTETATRLRQRMETIIDYALAVEDSDGNNPAKWSERLKIRLGGNAEKNVQHHRAVPYRDIPALMAKLRDKDSVSAMLLRYSILTAARSGEARGLKWSEVNLAKRMVIIPASRMKNKKQPHRVPLNDEAFEILEAMETRRAEGQELVFASSVSAAKPKGVQLSDVAVAKALRLAYPAGEGERPFTPHGTARSSFRDWVANETNYSPEVAEWALAHIQTDKVVKAYQRSDLFDKRVSLMAAWGNYIAAKNDRSVVEFPTKIGTGRKSR